MRPDMKDIIIDVYRRGRAYSKTSRTFRTWFKRADPETLPNFLSNRYVRSSYPNDRLAPLEKFFQSNVGRPWNSVYSEIREHCDTRNIRGQHLWEHVISSVFEKYPAFYRFERYGAYVDGNGLLQYKARPKYKRPEPEITRIDVSENVWYEYLQSVDDPKHKKGWIAPWAWYRFEKRVEHYNVWSYLYIGNIKRPFRLEPASHEIITKRQVGKRTLKKIKQHLIQEWLTKQGIYHEN